MNTTNKTIENYFLTNMAMCPSHVLMLINCNINIVIHCLYYYPLTVQLDV